MRKVCLNYPEVLTVECVQLYFAHQINDLEPAPGQKWRTLVAPHSLKVTLQKPAVSFRTGVRYD